MKLHAPGYHTANSWLSKYLATPWSWRSKRAEVIKMKSWRLEDVVCFWSKFEYSWSVNNISCFHFQDWSKRILQVQDPSSLIVFKYIWENRTSTHSAGSPTQIHHDLLLQINALDPAILWLKGTLSGHMFHSQRKGWNTIHALKKWAKIWQENTKSTFHPTVEDARIFWRWEFPGWHLFSWLGWLVVLTIKCCSNFRIFEFLTKHLGSF